MGKLKRIIILDLLIFIPHPNNPYPLTLWGKGRGLGSETEYGQKS